MIGEIIVVGNIIRTGVKKEKVVTSITIACTVVVGIMVISIAEKG